MKLKFSWLAGVVMLLIAGPAFSGQAMQMWNCGLEDGVSEADVEKQASEWLSAARKLDGGKNLEAMVLFPVAVNATGETDVVFVVTAPSFSEWGRFWDAYPVAEAFGDDDGDIFCPDSVVWEAMRVK